MILPGPIRDAPISTDICIIGGGPAAITVALELLKTKSEIVMLVGGGERRETTFDQDLNRGLIPRAGSHESLEENRRRVFGGATSVWGGRCVPFDPIDFKERAWIPYSGWPISYEDMQDYYNRATQLCEAGEYNFDSRKVFHRDPDEIIRGLDGADLESWHLERWSPPINFSVSFRELLDKAPNVRVFLDTHLIRLNAEHFKQEISTVTAGFKNIKFDIRANVFVLATGAIENARILLASGGRFHPNGIGNDQDLVGRFYMCHPHGVFTSLELRSGLRAKLHYEQDQSGVYCRRRWWIPEETQTRFQIANAVLFLDRPNQTAGHRDALFSCIYIAKAILGALKAPEPLRKYMRLQERRTLMREHLKVIVRGGFTLLPALLRIVRGRMFRKRRLPSVLPPGDAPSWGLFFYSEQVPNPKSRITVSTTEKDAHGMPRAVVDLVFSETDRRTVIEAHRIFLDRFHKANAGCAVFDEVGLEDFLLDFSDHFNSAAHHIGGTRMAASPNCGVVDSNCRVFGINNLYVAGSSVFPTSGHANPTLTIVALAIRLGDHLSKRSDI